MSQTFLGRNDLVRGIRNNNPGNLRPLPNGQVWVGEVKPSDGTAFSRFKDMGHGIRAMITDIVGDIKYDGLNTITKLITQYAPPSENDTNAYINAVSKSTGISKGAKLTPNYDTVEKLIKAKFKVELGSQSSLILQSDIDEGFSLLRDDIKKIVGSKKKLELGSIVTIVIIMAVVYFTFKK